MRWCFSTLTLVHRGSDRPGEDGVNGGPAGSGESAGGAEE